MNKNQPKVSIIIPVYNTELYIKKCLDTVIGQTYKNLEIILVNDGSTDGSGIICDEYSKKDDRIRVIHKENKGVSRARNIGIEASSGDYIAFIDSDDYIELNCFEVLIQTANKYKSNAVIFDYYLNYPSTQLKHKMEEKYIGDISQDKLIRMFIESINPFLYTKLFSRHSIGEVRFPEDIHWGEDSIFAYDVLKKITNIHCISNHLYHYVQSENSATRSKSFNRKLMTGMQMADYFICICKKEYPELLNSGYDKKVGMLATLVTDSRVLKSTDTDRISIEKQCKAMFFDTLFRVKLKISFKLFLMMCFPSIFALQRNIRS